jgi:hypothetical protein
MSASCVFPLILRQRRTFLSIIGVAPMRNAVGMVLGSAAANNMLIDENTLLAPRAVARALAPAFRATTVVIPGAAHMIPMTHPQAEGDALLAGSELQGIQNEMRTGR